MRVHIHHHDGPHVSPARAIAAVLLYLALPRIIVVMAGLYITAMLLIWTWSSLLRRTFGS